MTTTTMQIPRLPIHYTGLPLDDLIRLLGHHAMPLPNPGEQYLVCLVRRTHGDSPERPDPFNDEIGILKRHKLAYVPSRHPNAQYAGHSRRGGVLEWESYLGTAEPGWAPMHNRGNIRTNAAGCARFVAPQLSPHSHGGGYHHWDPDRPAFRQVRPVHIERYQAGDGPEGTGEWVDQGLREIAAHMHSIPDYLDWMRLWEQGVGDISHACAVPLHPEHHQRLLRRGGWTPDINGTRLSLCVMPYPTALMLSVMRGGPATPTPAALRRVRSRGES